MCPRAWNALAAQLCVLLVAAAGLAAAQTTVTGGVLTRTVVVSPAQVNTQIVGISPNAAVTMTEYVLVDNVTQTITSTVTATFVPDNYEIPKNAKVINVSLVLSSATRPLAHVCWAAAALCLLLQTLA